MPLYKLLQLIGLVFSTFGSAILAIDLFGVDRVKAWVERILNFLQRIFSHDLTPTLAIGIFLVILLIPSIQRFVSITIFELLHVLPIYIFGIAFFTVAMFQILKKYYQDISNILTGGKKFVDILHSQLIPTVFLGSIMLLGTVTLFYFGAFEEDIKFSAPAGLGVYMGFIFSVAHVILYFFTVFNFGLDKIISRVFDKGEKAHLTVIGSIGFFFLVGGFLIQFVAVYLTPASLTP